MVQGQSLTNRDFQGYPGLHKTLFQVKNQRNQTKEQYIKNRIYIYIYIILRCIFVIFLHINVEMKHLANRKLLAIW